MTPRRRAPSRAALPSTSLLLLLVAAATGGTPPAHPAAADAPLDPGIPNEQLLIARGLSGAPGPGQPAAPLAVDRVVTDGAATYVQFHSTAPLGNDPDILPQLYDDTGALVNYGDMGSYTGGVPGWARLLPPWFPWHPSPGPLRGVVTLGPLPPTARTAVLRFFITNAGTSGRAATETVRVPLNLAALRRQRTYVGPLAQRAGLQLRVAAARDTGLVLGFSPFGEARDVTLTDAQGRAVPLRIVAAGCSVSGFADVAPRTCRQAWAYSPQASGARLTLTIGSFSATPNAAVSNAVGAGPWRLPVVIP